jgi:hypothetical protein
MGAELARPSLAGRGLLLCISTVALVQLGFTASAEAAAGCDVHQHAIRGIAGSRALLSRGDAVVYRVRQRAFDTYWACSRRHHRRVMLGRDDSYSMRYELYGPTNAFGEISVAGDWVTAIHEEDNSPECGKYEETGCAGRSTTLVIANVALALSAHENVYFSGPQPARWLLSPDGGVAWLEGTEDELHGCAAAVVNGRLTCPELTLSLAHTDPPSMRLSGTTLTWVSTDGPHSATV